MDQEVQRPGGQIETTMVHGPSRRGRDVPWRVRANVPPSWWRRLVTLVAGDNAARVPAELETRMASNLDPVVEDPVNPV